MKIMVAMMSTAKYPPPFSWGDSAAIHFPEPDIIYFCAEADDRWEARREALRNNPSYEVLDAWPA